MTTETAATELKLVGADQVAAGWDKVAGAAEKAGVAVDGAGKKADEAAEKHSGGSAKLQNFGAALGIVAQGAAQSDSKLGSMVQTLGSAVSMAGSLETAMGPLGLALAAATTAYTLFEKATADTTAEIQQRTIPTLDQLAHHIDDVSTALAREDRLEAGHGSAQEYLARQEHEQAYQEQVRARIEVLQHAIHQQELLISIVGRASGVSREDLNRSREALAAQNAELERSMRALNRINELSLQADIAAGNAALGGVSQANLLTAEKAKEARERRAYERAHRHGGGGGRRDYHEPLAADELLAQQQRIGAAGENVDVGAIGRERIEQENALKDAIGRRMALEEQANRARHDADLEHLHNLSEMIGTYGGELADVIMAATKSSDGFGKAFAQGIAEQLQGYAKTELIKGLSAEAEAIGLAFLNPPAAGAKAEEGAMHLAIAALAGAGAAGLGAAGSAGGGRGAAGRGASVGGGGGAYGPSAPGAGGDRGGAGITIMINGPIVGAGQMADAGDEIRRALQVSYERKPETL